MAHPPTILEQRLAVQDRMAEALESRLRELAELVGERLVEALGGSPVDGAVPVELRYGAAKNADQLRALILATEARDIRELVESAGLADARTEWFRGWGELMDLSERTLAVAGVEGADKLLDENAVLAEIDGVMAIHDESIFGGYNHGAGVRILEGLRATVSLDDPKRLAARIAQAEQSPINTAMGEAITRAAQADRFFMETAIKQAEDINTGIVFLRAYAGPNDAKTRPFCKHLVGKAFDESQWDDMRNGQIADPKYSGGGYRCRHATVGVMAEDLADSFYSRGTDADVSAANAGARAPSRRK